MKTFEEVKQFVTDHGHTNERQMTLWALECARAVMFYMPASARRQWLPVVKAVRAYISGEEIDVHLVRGAKRRANRHLVLSEEKRAHEAFAQAAISAILPTRAQRMDAAAQAVYGAVALLQMVQPWEEPPRGVRPIHVPKVRSLTKGFQVAWDFVTDGQENPFSATDLICDHGLLRDVLRPATSLTPDPAD